MNMLQVCVLSALVIAASCHTIHMQQRDVKMSMTVDMQKILPSRTLEKPVKPLGNVVTRKVSCYYDNSKFSLKYGVLDKSSLVYGFLQTTLNQTGWDVLEVKTGKHATTDENLMYAAGLVEGVLTADRITYHYKNLYSIFINNKSQETKVRKWLDTQYTWAKNYAKTNRDPLGRHVGYVMKQLDGLSDGYFKSAFPGNLSIINDTFVLRMLNAVGDLIDLMKTFPENDIDLDKMTNEEFHTYISTSGHCSALVKVTGAYENIYMAHSSWFVYQATLRIYKHYSFDLKDADTAAKRVSFSSYPGFLESLDDFYLMDSNIVMLQTTNNIFNKTLYQLVKPQSLMAWQRVRVANHLARNGSHWGEIVATENSGTYNNQYMIIDLSKVKLNQSLDDGALTIIEQIPGLVEYSDQTTILRTGYWPSYNVPFHEAIYNLSGYPDIVKKRGLDNSYQLAPRAKIFRRDANDVTDMEKFKNIMRYNDYEHDPYSEHNAYNTICSRGDLTSSPGTSGCYDSKVTDFTSAQQLKSWAINGPTRGNHMDSLPPFEWSGKFSTYNHVGLPEKYTFDWVEMAPKK